MKNTKQYQFKNFALVSGYVKPQYSHNLAAAILVIFYTQFVQYTDYIIGTFICFNKYIFDLNGSPVFQYFYNYNTDYNRYITDNINFILPYT